MWLYLLRKRKLHLINIECLGSDSTDIIVAGAILNKPTGMKKDERRATTQGNDKSAVVEMSFFFKVVAMFFATQAPPPCLFWDAEGPSREGSLSIPVLLPVGTGCEKVILI